MARLTYQFEDRSAGENEVRLRRNRMRHGPAQVASFERPSSPLWRATIGQMERFNYPIIGYELWESARARIVKVGDPTSWKSPKVGAKLPRATMSSRSITTSSTPTSIPVRWTRYRTTRAF